MTTHYNLRIETRTDVAKLVTNNKEGRKELLNGGFLELRYTFHTHCGNKRRNKRIEHVRTSSSLQFQLQ